MLNINNIGFISLITNFYINPKCSNLSSTSLSLKYLPPYAVLISAPASSNKDIIARLLESLKLSARVALDILSSYGQND